MSRTKRRDSADVQKKRGDMALFGTAISGKPEITWKSHADGKKWYKPSKKVKKYLHKGRRAKIKDRMIKCDDFDNLPAEKEPRSDVWNYL